MNTFKKNVTGRLVRNAIQPCVILLSLFTAAFFNQVHAQANFTSVAAGPNNWNTAATWTQTGVDFDGIPDGNDNVTIANGHTVNLNNALPSLVIPACANLTINGSGVLNFPAALVVLTVNGAFTMNGTSQITITGAAGARTLNANSLSVGAAATNARISSITMTINGASTIDGTFFLNSDTGVKTFIGAVTNSGSWTSTAITTPGNLVFGNGATTSGSNFAVAVATFNTTGGQLIGGSAAMSFSGAVSIATDVTLTGTGTLSFASTVTLTGAGTEVTNNKTGIVTLSNTGAGILTGTAGATWTQGANSTLSYAGSTITTITLNAAVPANTPNTVIYTGSTATIFPASYNNLTYSGATTGTVATGTTVNISGNLTASSGTFTAAGTGTVAFNGSATQTISGAGTFNFVNLTVAGTAGNVNVDKSILINGGANALTFSANRLLNVNSTSNITLGATATVSGANASRYIQLDGGTGSASQLIKQNTGAVAQWQILYPIGSGGYYSPMDLSVGGVNLATNPTAGSTLSIKPIYNASIQGQLRRTFRIVVGTNAAGTTFAGPRFSYNETGDVSGGDSETNYSTLWYLNGSSGTWTSVGGTVTTGSDYFTPALTAPQNTLNAGTYYFTIGSSTAYPNTWYSYQTGVWSNWQNWTLDPSGTTLTNGLNLPPQPGDAIVILNGLIITNDVSGQVASSATINSGGTLDMGATTGNTLGTVSGSGLLRINGVGLPIGTYTNFVSSTGGTIEYYNSGGTLPTSQLEYNHLLLTNNTGAPITFTTANGTAGTPFKINGNLNITRTGGSSTVTWIINDNTANNRTLTITGNLTVSVGGQIQAGTGNHVANAARHALTLNGNLVNDGTIQFFNPAQIAAFTTTATLFGDAVEVTFANTDNQTITCNGVTSFYRLIMNKGNGQQSTLTVNSSNTANFRFYGPVDLGSGGTPEVSNNALSLVNGTFQLTGSITIPILTVEGGGNNYFAVPLSAALWLNGPNVEVRVTNNSNLNDDQRLMLNGLLRISNGATMRFGYSRGLGSESAGVFLMEGGTANMWQLRPRQAGTNNFAYIQTGGTVNIATTGYDSTATNPIPDLVAIGGSTNDGYGRLSLPQATCTFQMSGGVINIGSPTANGNAGSIDILSAAGNYNVTAGAIRVYIPTAGNNASIDTTAPIYDLEIHKEGGGTLSANTLGRSLTVLRNFTLVSANSPTFNSGGQNLTVGGNLNIQANAVMLTGTNTITFNGTGPQTWTNNGTINRTTAAANPALMGSIVVNKTVGTTVTLGGGGSFPGSSAITTGSITGLTITSGTLADGGETLTVTTTLSNSAIHSGAGSIIANGPAAIGGSNGTFGNLTISTNGTVTTAGDHTVTGILRLAAANSSLNIQSNNLTVNGFIYDAATGTTTTGFGATKRIQTSGLRNDGGLTRQGAAGNLLFPVGVTGSTAYTPATINVTATTHGKITMRPVTGVHPNAPATQSLRFYWRVTSTGYAGITPPVNHLTYNYADATLIQAGGTSYEAARYEPSTFTWSVGTTHTASGTIINPPSNTFSFGSNIDGEYTSGNITAGALTAYYSKVSGNWSTAANWSTLANRTNTAGSAPCATCPVVIGDGIGFNHTMTIQADNITAGSLQIYSGSTLDCRTHIGLDFGVNTNQSIVGTGTLRIAALTAGVGVFPGGDFTNFIGPNGGTVEWYGATKVLPQTSPDGIVLDNFYNLIINPDAAATITLPASNLTVYNLFTKSGAGTAATNVTATRTISLKDFTISDGTFSILTGGGFVSNFALTGDLTVGSTGTISASGAAISHSLSTSGNIINNGILNFRNTSLVNLTFTGATNTSLSGTGTQTRLNNVIVNKGTDQTYAITISAAAASMQTLTTGWLTLTNGTINFNNAPAAGYSLQTAAATYSIPSTARLKVSAGTVDIIGNVNDDAGDLLLAGTLEIAGGSVNINPIGNGRDRNNDIEYASAGNPQIIVSSGNLYVNGAVRRSTNLLSGALQYSQSGGTVIVGGRNADGNNTRGVFEIDNNTGSSFTMSGGTLTVQRSTQGNSFADLYINPQSSNVSAGTVELGMSTATATATTPLSVNILPSVYNFTVLGNTTVAQVVDMRSSILSCSNTLVISSNTTLETNGLDVNIGGNLNISVAGTPGVYNGTILGGNTTTFNGSGAQTGQLTALSTFQNITINKSAGTATLDGNSTINDLSILSGILSVTNTLDINGNVVNNSIQTGAGTLNFAGANTTHTITSSNGTFGNLNLGGSSATKFVNISGNMTITGTLNFTASGTSRYLNIGSNKLTFSQAAANVSNAGATRFIKINGVSSDLGVVKDWANGLRTFVYTVGTRTNYTPVSMTLTVSNPGTFTVIPVDDQHPTASALGEQIVNYYWIVTRGTGLAYNAAGSHAYQFPTSLIGGAGGTLVSAHLDAIKLVGWTTTGHNGTVTTAPPNTTLTFTNSLNTNLPGTAGVDPAPDPDVEFHYTAGTNTPGTATLPNPVTPVYSRLDLPATVGNASVGGDWTLATNWTTSATGLGGTIQSNSPTGRPVVILAGARINMNSPGLRAFSTGIRGLLVMTNPTGHNLGTMSGAGTLRATTSTLPAGNYTTFVSSAGGTIEYLPTPAADINLNPRSDYNNLTISGTNIVTMTNVNLTLNGSLTVGATATLTNTTFNRDLTIAGSISNAGTFSQGTGTVNLTTGGITNSGNYNQSSGTVNMAGGLTNAGVYNQNSGTTNIGGNWINAGTYNGGTGTVNFNGTGAQSIGTTNTFYNLSLSKSSNNVTLNGVTTVSNALTLTDGKIITTAANILVLTNAATSTVGSANSFVSGPMRKTFNGSFTFPLGSNSANRYRPATVSATSASDTWTAEYVGNNPSNAPQNYFNTSFNSSAPASLGKVSQFEYWNVARSGAATAALELTYNTGSYVINPTNIGNVANLKVVRWDGTKWDVPPGGGTFTQTGTNVTGTVKVSVVSTFSPFTFGSTDPDSPLPITLLSFNAKLNNDLVDLTWKTAQEIGNHHFVVEKTKDLEQFIEVGKIYGAGDSKEEHKYSLTDSEPFYGKSYYRLKQVDFDGKFTYSEVKIIDYSGPTFATLRAYPNPLAVNNENSELYIEVLGLKDTQIVPLKIYNLQGQIIFEREYEVTNPGSLKEKVDLPNRPGPGIYILRAGSTLHLTKKIVIE